MTTETMDFATFVEQRFHGKLYSGSHDPNGKACLHEALNVYQGKQWSDSTVGTLDLRGLNDARWSSDEVRTAAMLPLGALVLAWPKWTAKRLDMKLMIGVLSNERTAAKVRLYERVFGKPAGAFWLYSPHEEMTEGTTEP